jgi:hypothetical protein
MTIIGTKVQKAFKTSFLPCGFLLRTHLRFLEFLDQIGFFIPVESLWHPSGLDEGAFLQKSITFWVWHRVCWVSY